jgi:hypothetical protein
MITLASSAAKVNNSFRLVRLHHFFGPLKRHPTAPARQKMANYREESIGDSSNITPLKGVRKGHARRRTLASFSLQTTQQGIRTHFGQVNSQAYSTLTQSSTPQKHSVRAATNFQQCAQWTRHLMWDLPWRASSCGQTTSTPYCYNYDIISI